MTDNIIYTDEQGSEAWLAARKGVITGSRFKDCRDRLKNGHPSKKCLDYAKDVAREREGGEPMPVFTNGAMRIGTEQEPLARMIYERKTGNIVDEAGFITTHDRLFGVSVDGLVDDDGIIEIKTMVSSDTLFTAFVDGDISGYIDQCNGAMWLLGRKWVDLILWVHDLAAMKIIRINRDDDVINALESDLVEFERMVSRCQKQLADALKEAA
ncbi:YqaJ viral recombinase family protein [Advenella sp. WQ 585]|uniref:YqaJ viral recombinase family protein n=1 Tax=Advenella mandrilli TaxID=2800330 RepID=A0ABS1EC52_9BURK|nr:lambda exonuclease family protein [Advenella mandrilli]MBK1780598.1 YqaJ viral recombinase family protein [Advenella mandrilli]